MTGSRTPRRPPVHGWPSDRWPGGPTPSAANEDALVTALRTRDEAAFDDLVRRHHQSMHHVARAFVADAAVAEEVVQDTWLIVLKEIGAFAGRSTLKTWMYRILVNRARSRGERERKVVPFAALRGPDDGPALEPARFRDGAWASAPRPWLDPARRLASLELRDALRCALADLPDRQRTVVTLRDVEGFDAEETSRLLGVSPGCQRVLLHRGRVGLREALARRFEGDAIASV